MTAFLRTTLAAALAFGLAAAPSAQEVVDSDVPGTTAPAALGTTVDATPGLQLDVDDRDPGTRALRSPTATLADAAEADVAEETFSDRDGSAAAESQAGPDVSRVESLGAPLNFGREGGMALRAAEVKAPYDGPLLTGREDGLPTLALGAPYTGPLNYGREKPDETPAAVTVEDDESVAAAPVAASTAAPEGLTLSLVRPNPAIDRAELSFTLEAAGVATVRVFDVRGREVAVAYDAPAPADAQQTVGLDVSALAPGTYVAVLTSSGRTMSQTFQVVR